MALRGIGTRSEKEIKRATLPERQRENERLTCTWKDCRRKRSSFWRLCSKHAYRKYHYGHPEAGPIPPKRYAEEIKEVDAFLERFAEHPGLLAAKKFVSDWIDRACLSLSCPAGKEIRYIYDCGVRTDDIIRAFLPLYLFARRNPKVLPDDQRLTYALGTAVLHQAPRQTNAHFNRATGKMLVNTVAFRGRAREEIGRVIRTKLGAFCMNAMKWMNEERDRKAGLQNTMREEFK